MDISSVDVLSTVVGGVTGGLFRLVPEVFKFLDAKNERAHELAMMDKQIEGQKLAGDQKMLEIRAQEDSNWASGAMAALQAGIEAQGRPSGVKWIDGFSSLMRPLITLQWVLVLYPAAIVAQFYLLYLGGTPAPDALIKVFGPEEKALCAGILNFWFLGRVFDRALR